MGKYLDFTTWILIFALAPFTILVLLSQNTGPGDLFYPVKRGMENVILAGASFSPATKVAFRTDLTQTRFNEAEKLLLVQADTRGLEELVSEIASAEEELLRVSSFQERQQLTENLIEKIDNYETKLAQVQVQFEEQAQTPQQQPTFQQPPQEQVTPPASQSQPATQQPTSTPSITQPTSAPRPVAPTSSPTVTPVVPVQPTQPTLTPAEPTSLPSPAGIANPTDPVTAAETARKISGTRDELDKKKKNLETFKIIQQEQRQRDNEHTEEEKRGENRRNGDND